MKNSHKPVLAGTRCQTNIQIKVEAAGLGPT
jgi:hypothetical protein